MPSKRRRKKASNPWWWTPSIEDVVVTKRAMERSKIHPLIIEHARQALVSNKYSSRPRAKRRWLEIVYVGELKLALSCRIEEDKIVVTNLRRAQKGFVHV